MRIPTSSGEKVERETPMPMRLFEPPVFPVEAALEIEARWEKALEYYRSRGAVVFVSYCRFWETHGFVQQCLAQLLARNGVAVTWLDGAGWKSYHPTVDAPSPLLSVRQMPQLPARRVPLISKFNTRLQARMMRRLLSREGKRPVLWVQGGTDESLASELPYVDVFSTFDDPYRHEPTGNLCRKASLIVCQNSHAIQSVKALHGDKTKLMLPPIDLGPGVFETDAKINFPIDFPKKVMGYIGSFFGADFDFQLFEDFLRSFPDWGFLLAGRTDAEGEACIRRFKAHPNFFHVPWLPRSQLGPLWNRLNLSILFYRQRRAQDGAFPVKCLESMHFGIPCIATAVPKTADLEGHFPRSSSTEHLKRAVAEATNLDADQLRTTYLKFAYETHPKVHLTRVAEFLQQA